MIDSPLRMHEEDLEPPIKARAIRVTTTATYLVWVDDYEDRGAVALAEYLSGDPCDLSDLIRNATAIDGDIIAAAPDEFDLWNDRQYEHPAGPWQVCPFPGCEIVQYPAYSVDTTCHKHRVTGCQHGNLPEKTEWP